MTLELYLVVVAVSTLMLAIAIYVITGWKDNKSKPSRNPRENRSS